MTHFGILNLNKPPGCTSRDAVNQVERLARPAKTGHAGTLDPLATGVLVICVGQATRLIQYVQQMPKQYYATFLLGHHSVTDDTEREVTFLADAPQPIRNQIEAALSQFLGSIQQLPPQHSAVKVAGRRAYKMARKGQHVELAPRPVTIHSLRIIRYEYSELELMIECGSGTYVRSLGRDLAAALGTSAVMSALQRTAIGGFRVEDAISIAELNAESFAAHLQPALVAVDGLPLIQLTADQLTEIYHGRPIVKSASSTGGPPVAESSKFAALDSTGQLAAILYEKHPGQLWPEHNFFS